MFFKKTLPPQSHFRRYVAAKESWESVWQKLEFRPKTTDSSLRRQCIDSATEAAFKSSYNLLAVAHFNILAAIDQQLVSQVDEEHLLLECVSFASSVVYNGVNPDSEKHELLLDSRQAIVSLFDQMSLIKYDEIEDITSSRFKLYDIAQTTAKPEGYLCDAHARVLSELSRGEGATRLKIRGQDPLDLRYLLASQQFVTIASEKLREMFDRIIQREEDEEEDEEDEDEIEELDDSERRANRYHDQIDTQIESTYSFLLDRFGQEKKDNTVGQQSLRTLSVYTVHIATLVAIKREYPALHRMTLNGFTRALSFRTPNTMPEVKSSENVFVSYCSIEESFMHEQTKVFERRGVEPLARNLLQQLGGKDGDYNAFAEHLDRAARQASATYLPYLAEG